MFQFHINGIFIIPGIYKNSNTISYVTDKFLFTGSLLQLNSSVDIDDSSSLYPNATQNYNIKKWYKCIIKKDNFIKIDNNNYHNYDKLYIIKKYNSTNYSSNFYNYYKLENNNYIRTDNITDDAMYIERELTPSDIDNSSISAEILTQNLYIRELDIQYLSRKFIPTSISESIIPGNSNEYSKDCKYYTLVATLLAEKPEYYYNTFIKLSDGSYEELNPNTYNDSSITEFYSLQLTPVGGQTKDSSKQYYIIQNAFFETNNHYFTPYGLFNKEQTICYCFWNIEYDQPSNFFQYYPNCTQVINNINNNLYTYFQHINYNNLIIPEGFTNWWFMWYPKQQITTYPNSFSEINNYLIIDSGIITINFKFYNTAIICNINHPLILCQAKMPKIYCKNTEGNKNFINYCHNYTYGVYDIDIFDETGEDYPI